MKNLKLANGVEMPPIALGTFGLNRFGMLKSVLMAARLGYKGFDTSPSYANEAWLGRSLKLADALGIANAAFVSTKVSNFDQKNGNARNACLRSLKLLRRKQIDLYLMHWPYPSTYLETWKEMERLYEDGIVRAIGVCNFHIHHLEKLLEISRISPMVNQIELHPLLAQKPIAGFCENMGIKIQAYSPIARMHEKLAQNPVLKKISLKHDKSIAQIVLKWDVQHGYAPIPKSSGWRKLKQNIDIFGFELSDVEMKEIDALDADFRVRHDPDTADMDKL